MRRQLRFLVLVASLAFLVPWGVSRLKLVRGGGRARATRPKSGRKDPGGGGPGLEDLDDGH